MKKLLVGGIVLLGLYQILSNDEETFADQYVGLPDLGHSRGGKVEALEIKALFNAGTPLADLAEPGSYTVIEVYSIHCSLCRKLERRFPTFLKARNDVVIKKVKIFSGSITFTEPGEMEDWKNQQEAIRETYRFYGTPHIEIYDPAGNPIAKDSKGRKSGLRFLRAWLSDTENSSSSG